MSGTNSAMQCDAFANAWCLDSGKCSQAGSGCEAVAGCREAAQASRGPGVEKDKTPDNRQSPRVRAANTCEAGLVQGRSDQRQCFCPNDRDQRYSTNSASQCGQIARYLSSDKTNDQDSQDDEYLFRRCENLSRQADNCCANPASCMSAAELAPLERLKEASIRAAGKKGRGDFRDNGQANVNAGAVCTRSFSTCVSECEADSQKFTNAGTTARFYQVINHCKGLKARAQALGAQAMESFTSSFEGQNVKGLSQAEDDAENPSQAAALAASRSAARARLDAAKRDPEKDILRKTMPSGDPSAEASEDEWYADDPDSADEYKGPWYANYSNPAAGGAGGAGAVAETRAAYQPGSIYRPSYSAGSNFRPSSYSATAAYTGTSAYSGAAQAETDRAIQPASVNGRRPSSTGRTTRSYGTMSVGGGTDGEVADTAADEEKKKLAEAAAKSPLRQYLPGGTKDPRMHTAALDTKAPVLHGKHVDLFNAISERFYEKCDQGELLDCR